VNLLDSANLENSVAQSHIKRMENELSYYRHLLFASRGGHEVLTSTNDIYDYPTVFGSHQYGYVGTPGSSGDSESHVITTENSSGSSIDAPARPTSRNVIKTEGYAVSSANTSNCNTPVESFDYSSSPPQSPSTNLGGPTSMSHTIMTSQSSRTFVANSEHEAWGLGMSGGAKGDDLLMNPQGMAYLQSTQSSTVWAGSWD
jgi:hypothetical protein